MYSERFDPASPAQPWNIACYPYANPSSLREINVSDLKKRIERGRESEKENENLEDEKKKG